MQGVWVVLRGVLSMLHAGKSDDCCTSVLQDVATIDEPAFTVRTTGAPLIMPHTAALECGTFRHMIEDVGASEAHVPFSEARTSVALDLIDRLSARVGEPLAPRRRACGQRLDIWAAAELVEVALFLEHAELLRVVQDVFASVLDPLESPAAIRAALDVAPDLCAEEEAAALRQPLLGDSADPTPMQGLDSAPQRSLSALLRTDDAAVACLARCDGATLRKLLGVSRGWARHTREAAASEQWAATHVTDHTAHIGWAVRSPAVEDLGELLRRLPHGVLLLCMDGEREVDVTSLLAARVLDAASIRACLPCDDEECRAFRTCAQCARSGMWRQRHAAAMLVAT